MKKTTAPKAPSPNKDINSNPSGVFISMALDMSWKLAIVVILPIVLGNYIDGRINHSHHIFLIIGFVLAFVLTVVVMYTTTKEANELTKDIKVKKK